MEYIQLHLQVIFCSDAMEMLRFYISNGLKQPNRVPIPDFVQGVEQVLDPSDMPVLLFKGCKVYESGRTL